MFCLSYNRASTGPGHSHTTDSCVCIHSNVIERYTASRPFIASRALVRVGQHSYAMQLRCMCTGGLTSQSTKAHTRPSQAAASHIRTRLDPLTRQARYPDTPRSTHTIVMVYSTDPQPGVASVNPKPQCAFEELTFAKSCNSRYVSHFAAFFIDPRAE